MRRREALALLLSTPLVLSGSACIAMPLPDEVVTPSAATWARLEALGQEPKFVPHDYPPLGYIGPDTSEDLEPLTAIVDGAINQVLTLKGQAVSASALRPILDAADDSADYFATEDRDRVWGYLVEVWYILGFHVPLFGGLYGAAFPIPVGYGEPLPPGWTAPDQPRPIRP